MNVNSILIQYKNYLFINENKSINVIRTVLKPHKTKTENVQEEKVECK